MFYGREEQMDMLVALWRKPVSSFVVLRGRRRIGKSTLADAFAKESGGIFLKLEGLAPDSRMTNAKQLEAFRQQLSRQVNTDIPRFTSWDAAFAELGRHLSGDGRKIVLLDEISWMGGYDSTFPAQLKYAWDNLFKSRSELVLLVCGSVSAWIDRNILKSKGFVGRISLDIVVPELPLNACAKFWGRRLARTTPREIADILSVTGGVPRYLEEVDPALTADENIRRMCFTPQGYLFREFEELFNDVISRTAPRKRAILEALVDGPLSGAELAERLSMPRNGHLGDVLEELEVAGFVSCANGLNPATGRRSRVDMYRLRDNYTRFFLKYVLPRYPEISSGMFTFSSLPELPGWDSIMGLAFENLVLNNAVSLIPQLNLGGRIVNSASPYRSCGRDGEGVQIDLLIQTNHNAYVVEVERRGEIGAAIAEEIRVKCERLKVRRGISIRTVLVYEGRLAPQVRSSDAIDILVPFESLLK